MTLRGDAIWVWLALVLAVASLGLTARQVLSGFNAGPVAGAAQAGLAGHVESGVADPDADLAIVLDFAPFGRVAGVAAPAASGAAAPDLTLLGITLAVDGGTSRAMIAGGMSAVPTYAVGAEVAPGVVLTGVFPDHVVLEVAGDPQRLGFPGEAQAALAGAPAGPDLANLIPRSATAAPATPPPAAETALARHRAAFRANPVAFLSDLGAEAGPGGYRIGTGVVAPLLQAGLQPGDLVTAINGLPVGNPAADLPVFDAVAAAGRATVAVERDGAPLLLTFPLP